MTIRVGLRFFSRALKPAVPPPPTWSLVFSEDWSYMDADHLFVFGEDWGYIEPPTMNLVVTEDWSS